MEQAQVADKREAAAPIGLPLGVPSTTDLFVFRPLTAAPPPPSAQRPSSRRISVPNFMLRFRPAPAPVRAAPLNPQDTLLEPDRARFRRLLDQYRTFPTDGSNPAACVHFDLQAISTIYGLIAKSERGALTYADLHQLELAVLRVMPEAVLRGEARGRRARYRAAVSPARFHQHMRSKRTPADDAAGHDRGTAGGDGDAPETSPSTAARLRPRLPRRAPPPGRSPPAGPSGFASWARSASC